jgi:hypothetical protein
VASLLQGAKTRYYLLDPNGSSVGLIRRLLREKVPPLIHLQQMQRICLRT